MLIYKDLPLFSFINSEKKSRSHVVNWKQQVQHEKAACILECVYYTSYSSGMECQIKDSLLLSVFRWMSSLLAKDPTFK